MLGGRERISGYYSTRLVIVNKFMTADYKIKVVDTGEDFSIKYY